MSQSFELICKHKIFEKMADHKLIYKEKGPLKQDIRRAELLKQQEKNRVSLLDGYRKIVEYFESESTDYQKNREDFANLLMLSEWLYDPPDDLMTNWMFQPCPVGTRCLVFTRRRMTYAIHKSTSKILYRWSSLLPGGNSSSPSEGVMLDCIFSHERKSFYVLDVLQWNEMPLVENDFACRDFWLRSKLEEHSDVAIKSKENKFPFLRLPSQDCSLDAMEAAFFQYPYFPDNSPNLDGVLLYHKEGHYTRGTTPLVLWSKVFMLPEIFGVAVADEFLNERPSDYTTYQKFIAAFDKKYSERRAKNKYAAKYADEKMEETFDSDDEEKEKRMLVAVEMED